MARRRTYQLHQQLECRGLAGAVGTEEPEHLALAHVEREPIEGAIGALAPESDGVVFGELECRERCSHSSRVPCLQQQRGRWTRRPRRHENTKKIDTVFLLRVFFVTSCLRGCIWLPVMEAIWTRRASARTQSPG